MGSYLCRFFLDRLSKIEVYFVYESSLHFLGRKEQVGVAYQR